jgi:polyisoprenoid-binding protein YceI
MKWRAPRGSLTAPLGVALCVLVLCLPAPLHAQQLSFEFDRQRTQVEFRLSGNLHDVHGTFALKRGNFIFDSASGKASGQFVVDAASGDSGSGARDLRMQNEILESGQFTEIVFTPDRVDGRIPPQGEFQVNVHGAFRIHGADHELLLPVHAKRDASGIAASMTFPIPYVQWGMKNPSNFLLHVSGHVEITIHTVAIATSALASAPSPH